MDAKLKSSPILEHQHTHSMRFDDGPHFTGSVHEAGHWPGAELYYPPIKFVPKNNAYESIDEARARFERWGATTTATTLIFDLEDGCQKKKESRELLRQVLPNLDRPDLMVAIRINPFITGEYYKDLELIKDIKDHVDVIIQAKAGEEYGAPEIRDLCSWIVGINAPIAVEPIIEHPKSLKIVDQILAYDPVVHVVFGIHDFSKAMGIGITPTHWLDELRIYRDMLLFEARLQGKGVIGGVDPLVGRAQMPELKEPEEVEAWLAAEGDDEARVVYGHAKAEAQFGMTGKQVIHPYHIPLVKAAFIPSPRTIREKIEILTQAMEADALIGGAILYKGEMLDPPMFGKALQTLLKAAALGALDDKSTDFAARVIDRMPKFALRENWPYSVIL